MMIWLGIYLFVGALFVGSLDGINFEWGHMEKPIAFILWPVVIIVAGCILFNDWLDSRKEK